MPLVFCLVHAQLPLSDPVIQAGMLLGVPLCEVFVYNTIETISSKSNIDFRIRDAIHKIAPGLGDLEDEQLGKRYSSCRCGFKCSARGIGAECLPRFWPEAKRSRFC